MMHGNCSKVALQTDLTTNYQRSKPNSELAGL